MPNAWVTNVKKFAADNKLSYRCALSMSECKSSYKSTKTKPKESKSKEPETKPYTKYDRAIGPVKEYPLQVFKKDKDKIKGFENAALVKSKHKSYYKEMVKAALMQHGKEASKKSNNFLQKNMKYDFYTGKGGSYYHVVDNVPYTKYDKPIGPVKPVPAPAKKPPSYYKDMIAMAMKDYDEPKIKIPKSKKKTI